MNDRKRVTSVVEIPLTQGRFALVDEIDAEWALGRRWCVTNGYPARGVWAPKHRVFYLHREVAVRAGFLAGYDDDPLLVDHINRNMFDSRRCNLRAVTFSENNCNRTPSSRSGLLGVYQGRSGSWGAEITRNGRRVRKYGFTSAEDAAAWREEQISVLQARF